MTQHPCDRCGGMTECTNRADAEEFAAEDPNTRYFGDIDD